jgi:MFS family permease
LGEPEVAAAAAPDLWREPDFVRLWGAATVTNFGSMITQLALPFAAIQVLHATAAELGAMRALVLIPGFALGLFAGSWLDRVRRRPVLIGSDLLRALLYASVAAAAATGRLGMPWLYAVAFAAGVLSFVFHVARDAHLPSLVRRDALVSANARLRGGEAASEGAGFAVGGWLVQLLGAPLALLADAVTFVASAGLLAAIRAPEPEPAAPVGARGARERWREIAEGLRAIAADPMLRALALAGALLATSWQTTGVVYLLFLDELGFGAGWLGVVFAAGSVSSLLGALAARPLGRRLGARRAMAAGLLVHALSMGLVPLVGGPGALSYALLVAQQLGDGGEVVYAVHGSSYRQSALPLELQARAAACFGFLAQGGMLLGTAAGAALGELVGPRATLAVGAAGMLAATALVATAGRGRASVPR